MRPKNAATGARNAGRVGDGDVLAPVDRRARAVGAHRESGAAAEHRAQLLDVAHTGLRRLVPVAPGDTHPVLQRHRPEPGPGRERVAHRGRVAGLRPRSWWPGSTHRERASRRVRPTARARGRRIVGTARIGRAPSLDPATDPAGATPFVRRFGWTGSPELHTNGWRALVTRRAKQPRLCADSGGPGHPNRTQTWWWRAVTMEEVVEDAQGGLGVLAAPERDHVVTDRLPATAAEVGDDVTLPLQHVADVDAAAFGDHQLQQQLAAQVAQVLDRRRQPPPEFGTTGTRRGEHRAVAAGDARLLADRSRPDRDRRVGRASGR